VLIQRPIGEHRSKVIFALLAIASLASLASGARGGFIARGARDIVGTTAQPFLTLLTGIQKGAAHVTGLVFDYSAMSEENKQLRRTFGVLIERVAGRKEASAENERLRALLAFERENPQYDLEPAEVISRNPNGHSLAIDRGARHGIRELMCVVTSDGVIGIVTQVGRTSSNVSMLRDAGTYVDAMIEHSRVRGRIRGTGSDLTRLCSMEYIDQKDDVNEGDVVVASPDSLFPAGWPIGVITKVHNKGALLQTADVEPSADPFRVDEVLLILNADPEWREAASNLDPPDPEPVASVEMQPYSIQERYAP
jgi:rod shape-determining protein MreC